MRFRFLALTLLFLVSSVPAFAAEPLPDYNALAAKCADSGCCLASVRAMKAKNAILFDQTKKRCPEGWQPNMYRCKESYSWCEPKEEAGSASLAPGSSPESHLESLPTPSK